jgi:hypothetical protein
MNRLPGIVLLMTAAGLGGCAHYQEHPMARNPNKQFQHDHTAYLSVFLFKDGDTCKAKVSPEVLLVVKKQGKPPNKANVEWDVVNLCWDQKTTEEITVEFLDGKDPTERHESHPKEAAMMPNPDGNALDTSRDQVRRKLKINPGQGEYNYVIKRKVGSGTAQPVVDPRIEYEYRN